MNTEKFSKSYEAKLENLDTIAEDIETYCETNSVPPAVAFAFNLCVDEIFTNIVSYGYKGKIGNVGIHILKGKDKMTLAMRDTSPAFNPLIESKVPDTTSSIENRQIGGLGIFFLKKQMDFLEYSRINGENVLTMSKNL